MWRAGQTSSISIAWEPVRNLNSWPKPDLWVHTVGVGHAACLNKPSKRAFKQKPIPADLTGSWVNKFPAEMTHNHNFRLNEREVVKVPMMQTKGSFLAASDQELDCDVLRLEYMGGISMLVVVPHKLSGMKTLEAQLKPQVVERWQKSMTNRCLWGQGTGGPRMLGLQSL